MFNSDSYRQLRLSIYLLGDVAVTGVVCITSGLYILHVAGKQNGYTTLLSVIAYLLCLVVWIQTRLPLHNLSKLSLHHQDLPLCGFKSPATFCKFDLGLNERYRPLITPSPPRRRRPSPCRRL